MTAIRILVARFEDVLFLCTLSSAVLILSEAENVKDKSKRDSIIRPACAAFASRNGFTIFFSWIVEAFTPTFSERSVYIYRSIIETFQAEYFHKKQLHLFHSYFYFFSFFYLNMLFFQDYGLQPGETAIRRWNTLGR